MSTDKWTRNEWIGLGVLLVAIVTCVAAWLVVKEFRRIIGLESPSASSPATKAVENSPAAVNQSPLAPPKSPGRASKTLGTPITRIDQTDDAVGTPPLRPPRSRSDSLTGNTSEGPKTDDSATQTKEKPQPNRRSPPTCSEANTGHYGFTNTKTVTVFTVTVYYREGSDLSRIITVRPGQTQYVYDFPAGGHSYLVTYRAQVPIMDFPPGAPTMEKDVLYQQGQIYVEQCKSGVLDIK